jgi:hypothetical protein
MINVPPEENDRFPFVPEDIVAELERRFPDKAPRIDDSERKVWTKVGNVEVVRFLRDRLERQREGALTAKLPSS